VSAAARAQIPSYRPILQPHFTLPAMPWVLVPVIAIIAWAITEVAKYRSKGSSVDLQRLVEALGHQLDEAEAERTRLRQRVENLEAIVTSDHYELDREGRLALEAPPQPAGRLTLDDDTSTGSDENRAAQMARRIRG
jgi:hypothetical protein